ncbi:hypothetical protein O3P69_018093 [Scylla paramamosain]|uniref:Secreted protein n=1 Tax=Scylla paramamosain TaxID=85552 RepID=A0AAW0TLA1_SCYPA
MRGRAFLYPASHLTIALGLRSCHSPRCCLIFFLNAKQEQRNDPDRSWQFPGGWTFRRTGGHRCKQTREKVHDSTILPNEDKVQ